MNTQVISPFGFFTYDAFRAGWYFAWRLGLYLLPAWVLMLIGGVMMFMPLLSAGFSVGMDPSTSDAVMDALSSPQFALGGVLFGLAWLGGFIASIPLTSKIARGWAEKTWGRSFAQGVWWSIFWRVVAISILASIVGKGVNVVIDALTADTAGIGSNLVGLFLSLVVLALNIVVSLLSYGWAMSKVVADRLGGVGVATTVVASLNPLGYMPTAGPQYTAPPRPAPVARPAPVTPMPTPPPPAVTPAGAAPTMTPRAPAPPPPPPPSGAGPGERRQCPKCSLYETERGTVLGWYCKVCGWSESRA